MRATRRKRDGIVVLLRDGAWHALDDVNAITQCPRSLLDDLQAQGLVDVIEGLVTLVRLRPGVGAQS